MGEGSSRVLSGEALKRENDREVQKMDKVILGKAGLEVSKNGFGALPIQRITKKEAVYLLQKAFYNGINYFDTARAYSDSEEKIGAAFEYTRAVSYTHLDVYKRQIYGSVCWKLTKQ